MLPYNQGGVMVSTTSEEQENNYWGILLVMWIPVLNSVYAFKRYQDSIVTESFSVSLRFVSLSPQCVLKALTQ